MTEEKRLRAATFKHIESELYNYQQTLRQLKLRREELIHGASQEIDENTGGGKSNLPGNPTERRGIALVADKRLQHLEEIANTIEVVINRLHPEKLEFVRLRYWTYPQTLTWDGIALKLNISRKTAFRWRQEVIHSIAEFLGW